MIGSIARHVVALLIASAALLPSTPGYADQERRYALGSHGAVTLKVPDGWVDSVQQERSDLPPTITLQPAAGAPFQVLITAMWPMRPDAPRLTPAMVSAQVRSAVDQIKTEAVEKDIPLQELTAPGLFGSYFSATDRDPKAGEFKFITQGMLSLADLVVTFTILTNPGQQPIVGKALAMLKSMRREMK